MSRNSQSAFYKVCCLSILILSGSFSLSGCTMKQTEQPKTPQSEYFKPTVSNAGTKALDEKLVKYLRSQYKIQSATYFQANPDFSWQQVVKPVQNEMAEKSIRGIQFDWHSAGLDLVEIFPQGQTAFAVAMEYAEKKGGTHLVGYYVLEKQ